MEKGDKIKDIRDNTTHTVDCVDVYETDTLVFTEDKKYIPIEFVSEIDLCDTLEEVLTNNPEIIEEYLNETVLKPFNDYLKRVLKEEEEGRYEWGRDKKNEI